jgi:acylphosphatase
MYKCLKIFLVGSFPPDFLRIFVQKQAKQCEVEGVAQVMPGNKVCIIVCGKKEKVDVFLDLVHAKSIAHGVEDVEIEPFVKSKDYRGVFRVIE